MNLIEPIQLAGRNLLGCLCPERGFLPYWQITVDARRRAAYQFRPHCNAHNVGRWWNAVLRMEESAGFEIPREMEAGVLAHTVRMCDNPTGTLLDDPRPGSPGTWYIHSYRETMLALGLLAARRDSAWAREQGHRAVAAMRSATDRLPAWNLARCGGSASTLPADDPRGGPCYTHGRAIEGLLCFHDASGDATALDEARRLAEYHQQHTLNPDGTLAAGCGHHTHSYLNTLRGLALLAGRTKDAATLRTLLATYRGAVTSMITPSGFITHDIGARTGGDIASAGDIAHLALLLWDAFGDASLLDDAERLVRARLVPAQVRGRVPIIPRENGTGDAVHDLPGRYIGAIGGGVGHVRGVMCVTDFTAAAVHSLVELQRRATDLDPGLVRVNLHFDADRGGVRVRCGRRGEVASVTVDLPPGRELRVRVPRWAPRNSLRVALNDQPIPATVRADFAVIPPSPSAARAALHFTLPRRETLEAWRDEDAGCPHVTLVWRGDEVERCEPLGRYLEHHPKFCPSFIDADA